MSALCGIWKLQGRDTFACEDYGIEGEFDSEAEAVAAAILCLEEIEKEQPTAATGGQDGIQDQVSVLRPDGTQFRVK
jgi:hypothetical protein